MLKLLYILTKNHQKSKRLMLKPALTVPEKRCCLHQQLLSTALQMNVKICLSAAIPSDAPLCPLSADVKRAARGRRTDRGTGRDAAIQGNWKDNGQRSSPACTNVCMLCVCVCIYVCMSITPQISPQFWSQQSVFSVRTHIHTHMHTPTTTHKHHLS